MKMRGFTLVEVMLSIAVASGVTLAVFSAFQLINGVRIRQERAGVVAWEAELIRSRLAAVMQNGTVMVPAPQESTDTLSLDDGSTVALTDGVIVYSAGGTQAALSSALVTVSSLSFRDRGTEEHPGVYGVAFTVTSRGSGASLPAVLEYTSSIYGR